jgi:hypothetical protein
MAGDPVPRPRIAAAGGLTPLDDLMDLTRRRRECVDPQNRQGRHVRSTRCNVCVPPGWTENPKFEIRNSKSSTSIQHPASSIECRGVVGFALLSVYGFVSLEEAYADL